MKKMRKERVLKSIYLMCISYNNKKHKGGGRERGREKIDLLWKAFVKKSKASNKKSWNRQIEREREEKHWCKIIWFDSRKIFFLFKEQESEIALPPPHIELFNNLMSPKSRKNSVHIFIKNQEIKVVLKWGIFFIVGILRIQVYNSFVCFNY